MKIGDLGNGGACLERRRGKKLLNVGPRYEGWLPSRSLEVADRRGGSGADRRRQCGSKNETRRVRAHRIDDIGACRDVAAEAAERLRQRALDQVDAGRAPSRAAMPAPAGPYMPA